MRNILIASLLLLLPALLPPATLFADRDAPPRDAYGYALYDAAPECADSFVDVSTSGTPVVFSELDDGVAWIALTESFDFYGISRTHLAMSTNGYLAAAAAATSEDGADFSNDALLPAIPGNDAASAARLMVYHDALTADVDDAAAFVEYFASCPRASGLGVDQSCTVFQWNDWGFEQNEDFFSFQAVLYHETFEIVFQIGAGDSSGGASATFGLQDDQARRALQYKEGVAGPAALCFYDPRFPAGGLRADATIKIDDDAETVSAGGQIVYRISASNRGPSPIVGATIVDDFPDEFDCAWTCAATLGASCAASGTDDLDETVDLAPGSAVEFTAQCDISVGASGALVNTATISLPSGVAETMPANNTASADVVVESADPTILVDGFESGDFSAWSAVQQP